MLSQRPLLSIQSYVVSGPAAKRTFTYILATLKNVLLSHGSLRQSDAPIMSGESET